MGAIGAGAGPGRRFLRGARRLSSRAGCGTAAPSRDCHLGTVLAKHHPVASGRTRGPPRARAITRRTAYSGRTKHGTRARARAAPHAPPVGARAAPAPPRAAARTAHPRARPRRPRRASRKRGAASAPAGRPRRPRSLPGTPALHVIASSTLRHAAQLAAQLASSGGRRLVYKSQRTTPQASFVIEPWRSSDAYSKLASPETSYGQPRGRNSADYGQNLPRSSELSC